MPSSPSAHGSAYASRSDGRLDLIFSVALWFVRWLGPVFRIGRNPAVSLFLGRKIPDMQDGSISSTDGNGPTTVLDHFRMKFWLLAHGKNTRLRQEGSLPEPVLACFRPR